jgi:hypothetical protein
MIGEYYDARQCVIDGAISMGHLCRAVPQGCILRKPKRRAVRVELVLDVPDCHPVYFILPKE